MQQRIRKAEVGDSYHLFLADNAAAYQDENKYVASGYLDITRVNQ